MRHQASTREPPPLSPADAAALRRRFHEARRDPRLALLEGLHAVKHALRFGAEITCIAVADPERVGALAASLAPDVAERLARGARVLGDADFAALAPHPPATGVIAIAARPPTAVTEILLDPRPAPIVLLEAPSDLGNLGACIRVSAAADAAGVHTGGVHDPWDPAALRGSAGLHFALPVAHLDDGALRRLTMQPEAGRGERPLLAVHPDGEALHPRELPPRSLLAFGGERRGLSPELLAQADARVRLPMRAGVSSLNLATSVAALLYGWKLSHEPTP